LRVAGNSTGPEENEHLAPPGQDAVDDWFEWAMTHDHYGPDDQGMGAA
jgi:hypothetical protein